MKTQNLNGMRDTASAMIARSDAGGKLAPFFMSSRGITLLVAMMVLGVLSVVGIYAVSNAVIENRIAGNYRSANEAIVWSEAALEYGRSFIADAGAHPQDHGEPNCTNPSDFLNYPPDADHPHSFVCMERLKFDSVSTGGSNSAGGGRSIFGRVHYYRIRGITPYYDQSGNELGRREVESLERVLELTQ